ncbi:hypothetical protein NU09_0022 [Flavobacterium beibuense]|uniref:Uncharacterized protein n=1 Tax=Flavobacterium beibuense TaxID=657326 RepID=A0A444WHT7_9FLAO|nr:hypothetical protein NU09_0022 [Flavobacterium beibuense]
MSKRLLSFQVLFFIKKLLNLLSIYIPSFMLLRFYAFT